MKERLEIIEKKYYEIQNELESQDIYNDFEKMKKLSKEKIYLQKIVDVYEKYKVIELDLVTAQEMEKDVELHDFAVEESQKLTKEKEKIEQQLKILLLPKDENDEKDIIMEIRGAAGGDEANIFAGDLFEMYSKYAEKESWKIEVNHEIRGENGGYSTIEFLIKGENVYSKLKYESGAHRVQRVPTTETQGRVHTSTATVLVMPQADDVKIDIEQKDLKIDVCRSSGAGGQSVNTTDSAVRITHIPSGIVVYSQTERSQIKNKEKGMKILATKLYDLELQKQEEKLGNERRSKIGTGDRSEKIRTYNFPQNRLTDHRINYTVMHLDKIMEGNLSELISALINEDERRKLESDNIK